MEDNHLLYQIALTLIDGVGHKRAKSLLAYLGDLSHIFDPKLNIRTSIPGFSKERFRNLDRTSALDRAQDILDYVKKNEIKTTFFTENNFSNLLKECTDSPTLLFYRGTFNFNHPKTIAIVGTRNMTGYGKKIIHELLTTLASYNVQVISGLALGVDGFAHKKCLELNIPTIGVLGHGLDRIYPHVHRHLAQKMLSTKGCGLVTEFPHQTTPDRENFPQRNRIVAGLAKATIVIESGSKGGSLITANLANDYNRDVFTYPGNVNSPYSKGCNQLISQNKAHLITNGKDFVKLMGWKREDEQHLTQMNLFSGLDGDEKKVVKAIKEFDKISLDVLALRLKKPVNKLSPLLLVLEIKGKILSLPGKNYCVNCL